MKALIIIVHGSRSEKSNSEMLSLAGDVSSALVNSFAFVETAFLELSRPSINDLTDSLVVSGVTEFFYYPFFLGSGNHVKRDIPHIVGDILIAYPEMGFTILPHFGMAKDLTATVVNHINEANGIR